MHKDSIYRNMINSSEEIKSGFNHNQGVSSKFFSDRMYLNPIMEGFLKSLDPWFIHIIDSIRRIQFNNNYTSDKNDKTINI